MPPRIEYQKGEALGPYKIQYIKEETNRILITTLTLIKKSPKEIKTIYTTFVQIISRK